MKGPSENPLARQLGSELRKWLETQHLHGPKELAARARLSPDAVQKYLSGKNLPPPKNARALYGITGIELLNHLAGVEQAPLTGAASLPSAQTGLVARTRIAPVLQSDGEANPELPLSDPLTEEEARGLLDIVDVLRDPVQGDIRLTALERTLIDTAAFQRLRQINQLATTVFAYPGALHTRFLHSLGVLHVCNRMINVCDQNADTYSRLAGIDHPVPLRLSSYAKILARLCALLHDLAHVAFGHTFEKEGRIFTQDEWRDPDRSALLLGPESEVRQVVREFFAARGLPITAADLLTDEVSAVLHAKGADVVNLQFPFVHDLVGNTICADLIDYVRRDMYFAGLTERTGERFLEYLAVLPVSVLGPANTMTAIRHDGDQFAFRSRNSEGGREICRVVLLQYRYNEQRRPVRKNDIVAEAVDLVRRRLSVAEKLYYHRTKMVASAMAIAAADALRLTAKDIFDLSDIEVLRLFRAAENRAAHALGTALLARRLYKPLYRVSFRAHDSSEASEQLWNEHTGAYHRFKDPQNRRALIASLEELIGLRQRRDPHAALGSVCMSCPDEKMNLKGFDMLVLRSPFLGQIDKLENSDDPSTKLEIRAIRDKHLSLWTMAVYVDPVFVNVKPTDQFSKELAGAIQLEVGLANELEGFQRLSAQPLSTLIIDERIDMQLSELGLTDTIRATDRAELLQAAFKEEPGSSQTAATVAFLRSRGYKV